MRYVALLRGVNVGGHRKVPMADLREFAVRLGLEDPRTLLQSGNLVFGSRGRAAGELERLLETQAEKRLGLRTDFLVRTADEWDSVIAQNPFVDEARRDPSHLLVTFLKEPANKVAIDALMSTYKGPEVVRPADRHVYIVFPAGIGTSKLPALMTEARMGSRGTGRNWNTVLKLAAAMQEG